MSDKDDKAARFEAIFQSHLDEAQKTRDWVAKVLKTRHFGQAADALDEVVRKLRAEGCDRNAFIIAALMATISVDLSDDISTERLVDLLRKFMACGEAVINARRTGELTEIIGSGGAQA